MHAVKSRERGRVINLVPINIMTSITVTAALYYHRLTEPTVTLGGPEIGVSAILPGEEVSCLFMHFSATPVVEWFRGGQKLTGVPGKLEISPGARDSSLRFLTADAIVNDNYTCRATHGQTVRMATALFVKAGKNSDTKQRRHDLSWC